MTFRALTKVAAISVAAGVISIGWQESVLAITPFKFFYDTGAGILTGHLSGHVLADGNTVEIDTISNVLLDGNSTFSPYAVANLLTESPPGITSLDGLIQNFIACSPSLNNCSEGFLLISNGIAFYDNSDNDVYGPSGDYIPENWTLTRVSAQVPGPLPALGAAAAFGYSRKLRKRIAMSKALPVASAID
jgi:hypothetical protein